jgi:hypothetical protein
MKKNMKKVLFFAGVIILLNVSHAISGAAAKPPKRVQWADQSLEGSAEEEAESDTASISNISNLSDITKSYGQGGTIEFQNLKTLITDASEIIQQIDTPIHGKFERVNILNQIRKKIPSLINKNTKNKEKIQNDIARLYAKFYNRTLQKTDDLNLKHDRRLITLKLKNTLLPDQLLHQIIKMNNLDTSQSDDIKAAFKTKLDRTTEQTKSEFQARKAHRQQHRERNQEVEQELATERKYPETSEAGEQEEEQTSPRESPRISGSPGHTPRRKLSREESQASEESETPRSARSEEPEEENVGQAATKLKEEDIKSLAGEILTVAAEKAAEEKAAQAEREAQAAAAQAEREAQAAAAQAEQEALLQAEQRKREEAQAAEQRRQQELESEQQAKQLQQQREAEEREAAARAAAEKQVKEHENAQRIKYELEEKQRQERELAAAQREEERKRALEAEQLLRQEQATAADAERVKQEVEENLSWMEPIKEENAALQLSLTPEGLTQLLRRKFSPELCALLWDALFAGSENASRELFNRICDLTNLTSEKQRDWTPYAVAAAAGALGGTGVAHYYTENYKHAAASAGAGALAGVALAQKYDQYKKEWRPSGKYIKERKRTGFTDEDMFNEVITNSPPFEIFAQAWQSFTRDDQKILSLFRTRHFTALKDGKVVRSHNKEWRRTLRWVLQGLEKHTQRPNETRGNILQCVLNHENPTLENLQSCGFEPSRAFRPLSDFSEDDYKRDYRFALFLWLLQVPQEAGPAV